MLRRERWGRCLALKRMPETEVLREGEGEREANNCSHDAMRCRVGVSLAKPTYACAYALCLLTGDDNDRVATMLLSVVSAWDVRLYDSAALRCTALHCTALCSRPAARYSCPPVSSSWRREIRQGLVQIPHNLE